MSGHMVSVVIPTYNYGQFVTEAVESALDQTYANREVIVVDDGSKDDTRERLAPYIGQIRYIYQDNQGLSAARNTGIRAAKGELIAFLDSDDIWHPSKLELQVRYLAEHPEVGLLGVGESSGFQTEWVPIDNGTPPAVRPVPLEQFVLRTTFGPSGMIIRKKCLDEVGMFDTALRSIEDRDLFIRVAHRFSAVRMDIPLFWYRIHAGSMNTVAPTMETNEFKVLRKAFTELEVLRKQRLLRRQAFSFAAYTSALRYTDSGHQFRALIRTLWSFWFWPFHFPRGLLGPPFFRLKTFAVILLRLLRLKKLAPPVQANFRRSAPPDTGNGHVHRVDSASKSSSVAR